MIPALAIALLATASDPIPFAPPIDRPLRYRQTEHSRATDGAELVFTMTEEVDYTRDGSGYVMTTRTLSAQATGPAGPVAMFDAAMRPFLDIPVRLRLSATGEPGELIDAEAVWTRMLAAERASAAAIPAGEPPERRAMLERTARSFAALPAAAREAMMKAPAMALLGLDVPDLAVGASAPLDEPVDTPFGGADKSTGIIRRDPDGDGTRRYTRELTATSAGAPTSRLRETDTIALSASSGLLLASTRRIVADDRDRPGAERPISEQDLRLIP